MSIIFEEPKIQIYSSYLPLYIILFTLLLFGNRKQNTESFARVKKFFFQK